MRIAPPDTLISDHPKSFCPLAGEAFMQSNDARILRGAAIPTACAGLIGVVVGAVTVGSAGAIGAVIGTVLVLAFFAAGLYGMSAVGRRMPELFLGAGLLVYTTQILVLLLLLRVFRDVTFMDGRVFGITMLGCVLVWVAGQATSNMRVKTPYVVPDSDKSSTGTEHRS
ncbi:hypothetical protein [Streptomyces clavifer]|uniref:hypothetical protein n=1 Tax=Streptomyces clavifer TaxID=68188 RepID=UPI0036553492